MMKSFQLIKKLISAIIIFSTALISIQAQNNRISQLYVREAGVLITDNDPENARELLNKSIQYDKKNADAYYLLAKIDELDRINYANAEMNYDLAIQNRQNFNIVSPADFYLNAGKFFIKIRNREKAENLFKLSIKNDRFNHNAYIELLKLDNMHSIIEDALKIFPDNPDFLYYNSIQLLQSDPVKKNIQRNTDIILKLEDYNYRPERIHFLKGLLAERLLYKTESIESYITSIEYKINSSLLVKIIEYFAQKRNIKNTLKFLKFAYEQGSFHTNLSYFSFYEKEIFGFLSKEQVWMNIKTAANKFSGIRTLDENEDGLWEIKTKFINGQISENWKDKNQNGIIEIYEKYNDNNQLITYQMNRSAFEPVNTIISFYIPDLSVEKIDYLDQDNNITDSFYLKRHNFYWSPVNDEDNKLYKNDFLFAILRHELYDTLNKKIIQKHYYEKGIIFRIDKDENSDNIFEKRLFYTNNLLIRGNVDADQDGFFETEEIYDKQGLLEKIIVDKNNDGINEYSEEYNNGKLMKKNWDLDENGMFDIIEKIDQNSLEYIVDLNHNNVYDMKVKINNKQEKILSVYNEKNGKWHNSYKPVTDKSGSVTGISYTLVSNEKIELDWIIDAILWKDFNNGSITINGKEFMVIKNRFVVNNIEYKVFSFNNEFYIIR